MNRIVFILIALATSTAAIAWPQETVDKRVLTALVGNEEAIYLRGEAVLVDGAAEVTLPAWFESFTKADRRSIQLTCKDQWSPLWASAISSGKFTVRTTSAGVQTQTFWWEIKAECAAPMNQRPH